MPEPVSPTPPTQRSAPAERPIRFVGSDGNGLPLKRKQVQHACETCRKKKKKCAHVDQESSEAAGSDRSRQDGRRTEQAGTRRPPRDDISQTAAANRLMELHTSSRFVGDLDPEGVFIQAATPNLARPESSYRQSDLGIWLTPTTDSSAVDLRPSQGTTNGEVSQSISRSSGERLGLSSSFERARHDYLQKECLSLLPPKEDYAKLEELFFDKIHPIFPVLDTSIVKGDDSTSVIAILSRQVVCLAAATDSSLSRHLRLRPDGQVLSFQEFHQRLSTAVLAVVDADALSNRLDVVRILIVVALFYQPSSAAERDRAPLLCSRAVHHFHTLGAHLQSYRPQRPDENIEQLFCALWALDRLCATFYARPCLIHDRDIDRSLDDCIAGQPPCFRLLMKIIQCLDKVITLYRPRQPFVLIDLPVFELLMVDAGAEKLPTRLLATVEVMYHAVSVLSCRQPASAFSDNAPANDFSYIPHPTINPRRSLSADRIVWVAQNEEIASFPFIPYAVSLALTVQYRKMRYSRTAMFRNRARAAFKEIVAVLRDLGGIFSSARVNARLGESILKEMEKTAGSLVREDAHQQAGGTNHAPPSTPRAADAARARDSLNGTTPYSIQGSVDTSTTAVDPTVLDNFDVDVDLFGYFDPNFDLGTIDTALEANLDMGIPQIWTLDSIDGLQFET